MRGKVLRRLNIISSTDALNIFTFSGVQICFIFYFLFFIEEGKSSPLFSLRLLRKLARKFTLSDDLFLIGGEVRPIRPGKPGPAMQEDRTSMRTRPEITAHQEFSCSISRCSASPAHIAKTLRI